MTKKNSNRHENVTAEPFDGSTRPSALPDDGTATTPTDAQLNSANGTTQTDGADVPKTAPPADRMAKARAAAKNRDNPPRYYLMMAGPTPLTPRVLYVCKSYRGAAVKRLEAAGFLGVRLDTITINRVKLIPDAANGESAGL